MSSESYGNLMKSVQFQSDASDALSSIQKNLSQIIIGLNYPQLTQNAQLYLRLGILNRYLTIEENWRWIFFNIPADRKEPLSTHNSRVASVHLNSIYLHILGIMDNFGWLFLYQINEEMAKTIQKTTVSLYSETILALLPESSDKTNLRSFSNWHKDVRLKRHPVAHRLPLQIPSQVLSPEEITRMQELENQMSECILRFANESSSVENSFMLSIDELNKRNEETTNRINKHRKEKQAIEKATENLGAFIPGFLYPGENVIYPIYPTVTDDLKNLDTVTNLCLAIIKEITTKA